MKAKELEPLAEEAKLARRIVGSFKKGREYFIKQTIKKQQTFREISEKHQNAVGHFSYGLDYNPYHYGLNFTDRKQLEDFYNQAVKK